MASKKSKKSRKIAAVVLAVTGIAGLSLASAAQLNLGNTDQQFQAGVKDLAGCQSGAVTVKFSDPAVSATGEFRSSTLDLTGIDPTCVAKKYKVALFSGSTPTFTAITNGAGSGTIAAFTAPATSATVSVALGTVASVDLSNITHVALTIYS